MADGICTCGAKLQRTSGRPRKYCSKKCRNIAAYYMTPKDESERCRAEGCTRRRSTKHLCLAHYSAVNRRSKTVTIVCSQCGQEAQVQARSGRYVRYCSLKCGSQAYNDSKKVAEPKNRRLTKIQKAQRRIDKIALGTSGRTIWVSRRCKICAAAFITQSSSAATCCSSECTKANLRNKAVDRGARRRARQRDAYIAPVKRLEIFRRDKYRCHICKGLTNPKVCVPHPRAPTMDHIVPLAKGGTHEPANVATACFECNCLKRDEGGGEQLALIG